MASSRVALVDGAPTEHLSAWELGVLLGNGAFETMRSAGREVRALALHLARLTRSLALLGLEGVDVEELARDIGQARAAIDGDALVRAIVAARSGGGLLRLVLAEPWSFAPAAPVLAATVEATRTHAEAKLTSYGESWAALAVARLRGATEAVLVRDGLVGEGATSNVFVTDGERLVTAPDDSLILPGVTRQLVLAAAAECGLDVVFERPSVAQLARRGGFLTSTRRGVAPLGALDGATLPISPLVGRIAAAYEARLTSPASLGNLPVAEGRDPPLTS